VVAIFSNGTFGGIHAKLLAALGARVTRRGERPDESGANGAAGNTEAH
jgi:hypothetical protein